jgi:hypothetical protein
MHFSGWFALPKDTAIDFVPRYKPATTGARADPVHFDVNSDRLNHRSRNSCVQNHGFEADCFEAAQDVVRSPQAIVDGAPFSFTPRLCRHATALTQSLQQLRQAVADLTPALAEVDVMVLRRSLTQFDATWSSFEPLYMDELEDISRERRRDVHAAACAAVKYRQSLAAGACVPGFDTLTPLCDACRVLATRAGVTADWFRPSVIRASFDIAEVSSATSPLMSAAAQTRSMFEQLVSVLVPLAESIDICPVRVSTYTPLVHILPAFVLAATQLEKEYSSTYGCVVRWVFVLLTVRNQVLCSDSRVFRIGP